MFDEYKICVKSNVDFVKFTGNLHVILDCLSILHNSTSGGLTALIITYKGEGHPIKLLYVEKKILIFFFFWGFET